MSAEHSSPADDLHCALCAEIASSSAGEATDYAVALRDEFPVSNGHALVVPRRHVEQIFDLTDAEARDVWRLVQQVRRRLVDGDPTIEGFNVGVNSGEAAGQTVKHAHVHVIPRRRGDTPDPRGGVRGVIPDRRDY